MAGVFEGELAGGAAHIATNWLTGRAWNSGLGSALLSNAIGGGIGGGLGWAARKGLATILRNVGTELCASWWGRELDADATRRLLGLPRGLPDEQFVGFHGTSNVYAPSIRRSINPPSGANFGGAFQIGEGFYVTPDFDTAADFAQIAVANLRRTGSFGGDPEVLLIFAKR